MSFAFLPFLLISVLFLLPLSVPRLSDETTHTTKKYYKPIKTEKIYCNRIADYYYYLLPLLRFCLPSRTVILLTEITFFAHLSRFHPFPYRFPTRSHQYCLIFLRYYPFFVLFNSFYRFTFLFIIIPSFFILYLCAKTHSTNVYPEVTICASRTVYRRT